MEFCIEDSNLHSFRQGIRVSNSWKLVLMKNIEFNSKFVIFREPDLGKFSDWHATGAIFLKFCGPAGGLAQQRVKGSTSHSGGNMVDGLPPASNNSAARAYLL